MDNKHMRIAVSDAYSGKRWKERVRKMSEQRVFAVYQSLIKRPVKSDKPEINIPVQMTFDDFIKSRE